MSSRAITNAARCRRAWTNIVFGSVVTDVGRRRWLEMQTARRGGYPTVWIANDDSFQPDDGP
jgi:hypothetical protein